VQLSLIRAVWLKKIVMSLRAASRSFGIVILFLANFCLPPRIPAATGTPKGEYRLNLYHSHTGEHINIVYRGGPMSPIQSIAWINSCATIAPVTFTGLTHVCLTCSMI
jgi:hypothetical protein